MEIKQDDVGRAAQALDLCQHAMKWVLQRRHKGAPLEIDDPDRRQPIGPEKSAPVSGAATCQKPNAAREMFVCLISTLLRPRTGALRHGKGLPHKICLGFRLDFSTVGFYERISSEPGKGKPNDSAHGGPGG